MKPVAIFFVIALIPVAAATAHGKAVTATQATSNEKSVAGVAGPPVAGRNSGPAQDTSQTGPSSRHPSKKALKKARISPPPPMHDPN